MSSILKVDQIQNSNGTAGLTINTAGNVSLKVPAFSAYATGAQATNTMASTVVEYNNEHFDSDGLYDTSTFRFTPNVAGVYYLQAMTRINGTQDQEIYDLFIRKNGSKTVNFSANQYRYTSNSVSGLLEANGTTDYFDVVIDTGSSFNLRSNVRENWFFGHLVRQSI